MENKLGLTIWCKIHARPKNNNTVYDYQEYLMDCQDLNSGFWITNMQGNKSGIDSWFVWVWWWGDLN
jgi:hypothetical protein